MKPWLVVLLLAPLLAGCSLATSRSEAELTVSGRPEAVSAFVGDYARQHRSVKSFGSGGAEGATATIVLPASVTSKEVAALMARAMRAKLSVDYKAPSRTSSLTLKLS